MKKEEDRDDKKKGQQEVQTLTNSYLMIDPNKANGVLPRLYNYTDYNAFSRPTEDIDISTGSVTQSTMAIPNPITGKYIHLPDGSVSLPGLAWASDVTSGRYKIGSNNFGESVSATLVYDWNATRLFLADGYFLKLGATANIQDGATDYFAIDDSLNGNMVAIARNSNSGTGASVHWELGNNATNTFTMRINSTGHTAGAGLYGTAGAGILYVGQLSSGSPVGSCPLIISNTFADANSPIIFGIANSAVSRFAATTGYFGLNTATPRVRADFLDTAGAQLRLTYTDNSVYTAFTTDSLGTMRVASTGNVYWLMPSSYTPALSGRLTAAGAAVTTFTDNPVIASLESSNAAAAGMGAGLAFGGAYTGTTVTTLGYIGGVKENSSAGNYSGALILGARVNGSAAQSMERARITGSNGYMGINTTVPRTRLDVLDASAAQLRLTYTDNSVYTSFLTNSSGNLTISPTGDVLIVDDALRVGTATDAADAGDFASGLTGAARLFYDQSVPTLTFYDSSGTVVNLISSVASTATVWNEQGADIDFRVEGDADANLLFLDASIDRIGIGTSGPDAKLDILSTSTQLRLTHTDGSVYGNLTLSSSGFLIVETSGDVIRCRNFANSRYRSDWQNTGATGTFFNSYDDTGGVYMPLNFNGNPFIINDASEADVGINESSPRARFHISKSQASVTTLGNSRVIALQNTNGSATERQEIGFGYWAGALTYQPVVIGHVVSSGSGNTMGTFYVATRNVTTDTAPTERFTVNTTGDVGIGTTTFPSANSGKVLVFGDNAAQPTMGSNTAGFYGYDSGSGTVEAWCVDEAGNDTQLSPHDKDGNWYFNSVNRKTGRRLKVHMERMFKYLVRNGLVPPEFVEETNA